MKKDSRKEKYRPLLEEWVKQEIQTKLINSVHDEIVFECKAEEAD
jgi:DNA polymerase I-like protein with 3'-5' exonuclease and polymerase domains